MAPSTPVRRDGGRKNRRNGWFRPKDRPVYTNSAWLHKEQLENPMKQQISQEIQNQIKQYHTKRFEIAVRSSSCKINHASDEPLPASEPGKWSPSDPGKWSPSDPGKWSPAGGRSPPASNAGLRPHRTLSIDSQKSEYRMLGSQLPVLIHKSMVSYACRIKNNCGGGAGCGEPHDESVVTPFEVLVQGYLWHRVVARGAFSTLYEASRLFISRTHGKVACKHVRLVSEQGEPRFLREMLDEEIRVMKRLKHPNIVPLYEVIQNSTDVYIMMQFAANKTIFDYMYGFWLKPLPETYAKRWMRHLMSGLEYMHANRIAHRDLKLDNFLLDEKYTALLSDFGLAIIMDDTPQAARLQALHCGTMDYMAPEVHEASLSESLLYDPFPADIYSMGVSLFEMCNYYRPFAMSLGCDLESLLCKQRYRRYTFNKRIYLTDHCRDLLAQLLEPRPQLRITASQVLKHRWFKYSIR